MTGWEDRERTVLLFRRADLWHSELHVALATTHPHIPKQHVAEGDGAQVRGGYDHKWSDCISGGQSHHPAAHGSWA